MVSIINDEPWVYHYLSHIKMAQKRHWNSDLSRMPSAHMLQQGFKIWSRMKPPKWDALAANYNIYIYPSLPKAILNLVFVQKTKLNIAFRGSCRSRPVTVMSCSCCRLQIVQILTNLDSQESKGLWTIKPLPTRAHFSSANACSHQSVLRSVATS
jgi:hypothetical protein